MMNVTPVSIVSLFDEVKVIVCLAILLWTRASELSVESVGSTRGNGILQSAVKWTIRMDL